MKPTKSNHIVLALALLTCLSTLNLQLSTAFAQGTAFTYQGRLNSSGSPANGSYDFRFKLYSDPFGNNQVGATQLTNAIPVTTGLFTTTIDFGAGIFTGSNYWLEVDVRTNGVGGYTVLSPLQAVTPTPYAIMANTASNLLGTLPAAQLSAGTANISITGNAATVTHGVYDNGSYANPNWITSLAGTKISGDISGNAATATTATTANNFSGSLSGDVTGTQGATLVANVGGQSAANVAGGASAANAATGANTANTIVKRDASGNFSAGTVTANLAGNAAMASNVVSGIAITNAFITNSVFAGNGSGLTSLNPANLSAGTAGINISGNASTATSATSATTATTATTANNFSGSLSGDVTGTQGATLVANVGGQSAANVASGASAANSATSANTASTIVKRDASGNFSASTVTANLAGNATTATSATLATTANNFSGSLSGDVTGTQGATVVANVGGQTAANVAGGASAANAATSANTADTIVKRDASGNFSAGTITANLSGNATSATTAASLAIPSGMALIPASAFTMGDTLDGIFDAVPISVTVSAFYMDVNLVSFSQWQSVYFWATNHGYGFVNVGAGKAANHPVQTVDWYDSVKWCNARSEQAGKTPVYYTDAGLTQVYTNGETDAVYVNWTASGYRLPTEAEWEKAARGGLSGQRFPWGNVITENLANYYGYTGYSYDLGPNGHNSVGLVGGFPYTSPVGSFAANGYGLYDMAGNVLEWCWDWYGMPYAGGSDPHGPGTGSGRVLRGGSWNSLAVLARCALRNGYTPNVADFTIGFRCVRGL